MEYLQHTIFFFNLGEEPKTKLSVPCTLLLHMETVTNSRGWVGVVPFPATISGPDNQDLLA